VYSGTSLSRYTVEIACANGVRDVKEESVEFEVELVIVIGLEGK
jgi:hypothetical protein